MCIDLIAPGATFACWSCIQFSQISKDVPVMRLGLQLGIKSFATYIFLFERCNV